MTPDHNADLALPPPSDAPAPVASWRKELQPSWVEWSFISLVVLTNLYILWLAWEDSSFLSVWLGIVIGPVINGVLFLAAMITLLYRLARRHRISALGGAAMAALPMLAVIIDFIIIIRMDVHGC